MIRDAKSPTLVREMLLAYLPEKHRHASRRRSGGAGGGLTRAAASGQRAWRRKKRGGHGGGGHGWFVTFADLMGLLVAFFVMLVAFSTQDQKKMQIVAGSMREAFGVQTAVRYSGIIEIDGLPTRPKLKNAANIKPGGCLGDAEPGREEPQPAISARGSTTTAPSRWPRPRCGRRCRTCRRSPSSPSTS